MKHIKITLFALALITFFSCKDDDDTPNMVNIDCGTLLQQVNDARTAFENDPEEPFCTSFANLLAQYLDNCPPSAELQQELDNLNCSGGSN